MYRGVIGLTLISVLVASIHANGYYTIVGPENVRLNSDYNVWVTLHNQTEPTTIRLSIQDNEKYKNEQEITVSDSQPKLVTLHVGNIFPNGNYKLVAEGLSGIVFKNESSLSVEKKNASIFIQTDKAIYKPGESIRFRVLVLNEQLQPAAVKQGDLLVYIKDNKSNRVKQWKDVVPVQGVFTGDLQLSDQPILGDWTIVAEFGEESKTKDIEVAEYVLPKFEVTIDSPTQFSAKKNKVRLIVRSKYTYGKLVQGDAIVSLTQKNSYYWGSSQKQESAIIKNIKVDGKGVAEFDVNDDIQPNFEQYRSSFDYEVRATVIESLTGLNQTATKDITLHRNLYKFDTIDRPSDFKAGLPVNFILTIKHQDDSLVPINANTKEVVIVKSPNNGFNVNNTETYHKFELNENGTVAIQVPTSNRDNNGFSLKVKFDDEDSHLGYFYVPSVSVRPDFVVKILKKSALGETIYAEIESKEPLTEFTYQVIARGRIVRAETVSVPNREYHVISFPATFQLAPSAHLLVFYFKDNEIQSAYTDISLREDLNNYVKVKLSTQKAKPGSSVDIDISTNPHSFVGLLGVDQSVLLLKKNQDLSKEDAFSEIEQYQNQIHEHVDNPNPIATPYYSDSYWSHFRSCKVILFTNAKKDEYYARPHLYYSSVSHKRFGVQSYGAQQSALTTNLPGLAFAAEAGGSAAPPPPPPPPPPTIRKEFPETWLWQSISNDDFNGTQTIQKTVPDTITSWVISAFSINPETGLGLTKKSKILEVFQPFFVSLNLPFSVKRGEVLTIPAIVFNYLDDDAVTEVTLHNEHGEFVFVGSDKSDETSQKKEITVKANNGASTSFVIRPTKVGPISIKVVATTALASDGVDHILTVEPEGVPQFVNKPLFIDLRDISKLETTLTADIPETAVPDSAKLEVNVVGDILGGTIKNLHSLIRLPSGCGEQNLLNFVPNIVVLNYLKATNQIKPDIERKAKKFTESGYQRQLTYRHDDGSFSAFGKVDKSGSTWLTAFVAKSFRQAASHIDIEESIIAKALEWLSKQQATDGSFPEVGKVSHKDMQGGSGHGVALTAYTLTTFLENKQKHSEYQSVIDKAIANVVDNLQKVDDIYAYSVAAYALQLAGHTTKSDILNTFIGKATTKDGVKWWRKSASSPRSKDSKSINIEITSYGLLTLLDANQPNEAFPYFKWLLEQRNDHGGFEGTQDTVLGLQALARFAERISRKDSNVQIVVSAENTNQTFLNVHKDNALILQSAELPSSVRSIAVAANGKGFALLQLSYRYNLDSAEASPAFTLKSEVKNTLSEGQLKLEVCSSYNAKENDDKESNMAVLEVSLPSGFTTDKNLLSGLLSVENVKKIETKNGDTKAVIYFDSLSEKQICLTIDGFQSHKVAEQKPASIVLYDYYDNSRIARSFYSL